jgi:hypothetical protein
MSVTDMETAVDARLALTKSDSLGRDLASLTLRVVQLETAAAARGESSGHRATIVVAVIGAVGSLLVGVVLWALNFAATTKTEAVDQSTRKVDQKIEAAQEPAAAAYMRGVREGADEALSRLKKEQEQQDLVVVPRNVLKGRPTDKRP